jgi:hypothetical protein
MNRTNFLSAAAGLIILGLLSALLYNFQIIDISFFKTDLILCDTIWYNQIKNGGYFFVPYSMCNLAFFPMFPYFWKLLSVTPLAMGLINSALFIFSLSFLLGRKPRPIIYTLVISSFPSFIFFVLPYSEALFFLFAAILIRGYEKKIPWLVLLGMFGCSLTRSVSAFFIPAIIVTEFLANDGRIRDKIINATWYSLASLAGVAITTIIQFLQTGKVLYFLTVQRYWGRNFIIPSLPFTTESASRVLGVDAIALTIGLFAAFLLLCVLISRINRSFFKKPQAIGDRALIFSLLYLVSITILDCFFTSNLGERTTIWSINRHILCTPFFIYLLDRIFFQYRPGVMGVIYSLAIIIIGTLITTLWNHQVGLAYYFIFFITLFLIPISNAFLRSERRNLLLAPLYAFNLFLWIVFMQAFLQGKWIG